MSVTKPKDAELFEDLTIEYADEEFINITSLTSRNLVSISLWTAEECNLLIDALRVGADWLSKLGKESDPDIQGK